MSLQQGPAGGARARAAQRQPASGGSPRSGCSSSAASADVAPQLYRLARDRSVDELGLNPGALHALWTLHGLGQLTAPTGRRPTAATAALAHPVGGGAEGGGAGAARQRDHAAASCARPGCSRTAIRTTRLAAVLALSQLPASEELGQLLYALGKAPRSSRTSGSRRPCTSRRRSIAPGYLKAYAADARRRAVSARSRSGSRRRSRRRRAAARQRAGRRAGQRAARRRRCGRSPSGCCARTSRTSSVRSRVRTQTAQIAGGCSRRRAEPALELTVIVVRGQMKFSLPNFTVKPSQRVRSRSPTRTRCSTTSRRASRERRTRSARSPTRWRARRTRRSATTSRRRRTWSRRRSWSIRSRSFTLEFTAPRQTGDYPYICTFPGPLAHHAGHR